MKPNRYTVYSMALMALIFAVLALGVWIGHAGAATHAPYPRGHAHSCRAGYSGVTERHVIKGKSVRFVECVWRVATVPTTTTTLPVRTTQPTLVTTEPPTTVPVTTSTFPPVSAPSGGGGPAPTTTTTLPWVTDTTMPTDTVNIKATLVICHSGAQEYPLGCEYTVTGAPLVNGIAVPVSTFYFTVSLGVYQVGGGTIIGDSVTHVVWTARGTVSVTFGFAGGVHVTSPTLALDAP